VISFPHSLHMFPFPTPTNLFISSSKHSQTLYSWAQFHFSVTSIHNGYVSKFKNRNQYLFLSIWENECDTMITRNIRIWVWGVTQPHKIIW
jgi:hypothetical protein